MVVEGYKIKAYQSRYRGNLLRACSTVGMVRMDVYVANVLKGGRAIHSILIAIQGLQPGGHRFFDGHDLKHDNRDKRSYNPRPLKQAQCLLPELR